MEQNKTYVYIFEGEFNSEEDNNSFSYAYGNKDKAIQAWKDYVKAEKESDFVKGNSEGGGFVEFSNYISEDKDDDVRIADYYFGDYNNEYYTCARVLKLEVIE